MLHAFIFSDSFNVSHQSSKRKILLDKATNVESPKASFVSTLKFVNVC